MIKLYRYVHGEIQETRATKETDRYWVIGGYRNCKVSFSVPTWHRSEEEAIASVMKHKMEELNEYSKKIKTLQKEINDCKADLSKLEEKP